MVDVVDVAERLIKSFVPPGPIADGYLTSNCRNSGIMGPVGSGKTTATMMRIIRTAAAQRPCDDGVSRIRFAAIRNTYPDLAKTTIPSWKQWFGDIPGFTGGVKSTGYHRIKFMVWITNARGKREQRKVELDMWFVAIGDDTVENACRGLEVTGIWLNEADLCNPDIFNYMSTRVGRYLPPGHPGNDWSGILMDYNAPDEDNWLYKLMEIDREGMVDSTGAPLVDFYDQPGGLDPNAENKAFLDEKLPGYYQNQIAILSKMNGGKGLVRRMVHNKYGYTRAGKPVFEQFDDERNVSQIRIEVLRDPEIVIGFDQGLNPAAVIGQLSERGQLRILRAISPRNIRAGDFSKILLSEIQNICPGREILGIGDPAGFASNDQSEDTWMDAVAQACGIEIIPAFTNAIQPRLDAVDHFLSKNLPDGSPGMIMDDRSKILTKSLISGYYLKRVKDPSAERYADKPDKSSPFADVADALQYIALHFCGEGEGALRGRETATAKRTEEHHAAVHAQYAPAQNNWNNDALGGYR